MPRSTSNSRASAGASARRRGRSSLAFGRSEPVTKGERTREQIIESAAAVFNQKGYAGASLADVMEATGLRKGGIYRHFQSKEELAVAAFEFAIGCMAERFRASQVGQVTAVGKLGAIVGVYAEMPTNPPVPGGCPLLNTAVDADDSNPVLRERARETLASFRRFLAGIVAEGQACGQIAQEHEPNRVADVMLSTLEGAVMVTKLMGSSAPMSHATGAMVEYLASLAPSRPKRSGC